MLQRQESEQPGPPPLTSIFCQKKKPRATLRRVAADPLQPGDQHQKKTIKIKAHQSWTVTAEGGDVSLEEHKTLSGVFLFLLPGEQHGSHFLLEAVI